MDQSIRADQINDEIAFEENRFRGITGFIIPCILDNRSFKNNRDITSVLIEFPHLSHLRSCIHGDNLVTTGENGNSQAAFLL
jgi:hypothetical protein